MRRFLSIFAFQPEKFPDAIKRRPIIVGALAVLILTCSVYVIEEEKEMNNRAIWLRIIISCLYGGLAVISYLWDFTVMLMLLGIPWSIPLMMFSGLILHMTVEGRTVISVGSMIGVMLNVGLYLFILRLK